MTVHEKSTKRTKTLKERGYIPLNLSLRPNELELVERLKSRLQEKESELVTVTTKRTILEALKALETKLDKLDRDKGRDR